MINLYNLGTETSPYGTQRGSNTHKGVDIVLKKSTIPSVTSGTVSTAGWSDSAGWWVVVRNDDGTTAKYMHMKQKPDVVVGQYVVEGQPLGVQGNTGNSNGTHLHFQIEQDGKTLDPKSYFSRSTTGSFTSDLSASADAFQHDTAGGVKEIALGLVGKVIYFICILLVLVLAAVLFFKAFDIKILGR